MVLIAAISGNALADGRRHDRYDSNRGHYRDHQRDHHRDHRSIRGGDWIAPLVVLGLAGAVIGAAASAERNIDPPVYYAPPPVQPIRQSTSMWYYCQSAQQYYPYVQYCSEGWLPVRATPR